MDALLEPNVVKGVENAEIKITNANIHRRFCGTNKRRIGLDDIGAITRRGGKSR